MVNLLKLLLEETDLLVLLRGAPLRSSGLYPKSRNISPKTRINTTYIRPSERMYWRYCRKKVRKRLISKKEGAQKYGGYFLRTFEAIPFLIY